MVYSFTCMFESVGKSNFVAFVFFFLYKIFVAVFFFFFFFKWLFKCAAPARNCGLEIDMSNRDKTFNLRQVRDLLGEM
jgi:hypothetical protein